LETENCLQNRQTNRLVGFVLAFTFFLFYKDMG